jgi:hypothetical protein
MNHKDRSDRSQSAERRRAKRVREPLVTTLRHGAFEQHRAEIHSMSFTGIGGSCRVALEPTGFISVALPAIGLVRARVIWSEADRFGAEFLRPVDVRKCTVPGEGTEGGLQ